MRKSISPEITCPGQAIEQERRFAHTLPLLNLDPMITDRIIELALEGEKIEGETVSQRPLKFRRLRRH